MKSHRKTCKKSDEFFELVLFDSLSPSIVRLYTQFYGDNQVCAHFGNKIVGSNQTVKRDRAHRSQSRFGEGLPMMDNLTGYWENKPE